MLSLVLTLTLTLIPTTQGILNYKNKTLYSCISLVNNSINKDNTSYRQILAVLGLLYESLPLLWNSEASMFALTMIIAIIVIKANLKNSD
jgi:hypothetical protein